MAATAHILEDYQGSLRLSPELPVYTPGALSLVPDIVSAEFVDPISRHPLIFVPSTEVHVKPVRSEIDCHHLAHPMRHRLLQGNGGKAIRYAMGQFVSFPDHHGFHRERGSTRPSLPDTDDDRCRYLGFALAGYLYRGICFRTGNPQAVILNNRQRQRLWYSGELGVLNSSAIRDFLVSHIMDQPMPEGYFAYDKEFYECENPKERRKKGHEVLALKVQSATENFREDYQEAWRNRLLRPNAPERPSKLVHDYIGNFELRDRIVDLLYKNAQSEDVPSLELVTR